MMDLFEVPYLSDAALAAATAGLAHQEQSPEYVLDRRAIRIKYDGIEGSNTDLDAVGNADDLIELEVSLPLWLVEALEKHGDPSLAIIEAFGALKDLTYKPSWTVSILARLVRDQFTL